MDDPGTPVSPSEIVLEATGEDISGVEGTYCWEGRCVDKIGPVALVEHAGLNATTLPLDASCRFTVPDGRQPVSYEYTVYRPNNTIVDSGSTTNEFTRSSLEPGAYLLVGHGRWSPGDASYVFEIRVTE